MHKINFPVISKVLTRKACSLLSEIVNCLYDLTAIFHRDRIFINSFVRRRFGQFCASNWGDDINIFFFREILDCKIYIKSISPIFKHFPISNFGCIGSILCRNTDKYSEIWGSGLIDGVVNLNKIPSKIHSVRGPMTRAELLKCGIPCPEKYGDPALLISRYYKPQIAQKYALGIIPHANDENEDYLVDYCRTHDDVLLISMTDYKDWHEIPDKILSCQKIISSSLHGLIVADSYGVANSWAQLSPKNKDSRFKYMDYLKSVGREDHCNELFSQKDIDFFRQNGTFSVAKDIDFKSILDSCPFKRHIRK